MSEGVNDAGVFQCLEVDERREDERLCAWLDGLDRQIAVYFEAQPLMAMCALGFDARR